MEMRIYKVLTYGGMFGGPKASSLRAETTSVSCGPAKGPEGDGDMVIVRAKPQTEPQETHENLQIHGEERDCIDSVVVQEQSNIQLSASRGPHTRSRAVYGKSATIAPIGKPNVVYLMDEGFT